MSDPFNVEAALKTLQLLKEHYHNLSAEAQLEVWDLLGQIIQEAKREKSDAPRFS